LLIYWLLFAFFALGAMVAQPVFAPLPAGAQAPATKARRTPFRLFFAIGAITTILVIGLRYKVGADWYNYLVIFNGTKTRSLISAVENGDPGYQFLNWATNELGAKIWLVNLASAAIFGWGLYRLSSVQPSPWLAFAVAVPYMVIVVAMGYTRQSIALGVLMAGLARQSRGAGTLNFAIYVAVAAAFHKTAVVMFPLVALTDKGSRLVNFLLAVSASVLMYDFFLGDSMDVLVRNYIDTEYSSQGALTRCSMNFVAAVLLWIFKDRLGFDRHEFRIWRNFGLASLLSMILLGVLSSSTVVDRLSLYLMPLQIVILTRAALLGGSRLSGTAAVLTYSFSIQFVWLNFADHARYWVPYQLFKF
jgi:hypothetical protein